MRWQVIDDSKKPLQNLSLTPTVKSGYTAAMKNILVFLLILMLPLQASWSAAALFCQHETSGSFSRQTSAQSAANNANTVQALQKIWHWGHHQHEPDASCGQASQSIDQQTTLLDAPSAPSDSAAKHQLNFASHSDHLNINQQAIKQQDSLLPTPEQLTFSIVFAAPCVGFYQSPILEQPEPPLWSA